MGWNIIFDPLFSVPLLLGIGAVTALVVLLVYARTARGMHRFLRIALVLMRVGVLCGLIVLLMRPMALIPQEESRDKPALSVLVDTSQSMNTKDVENQSRYEAAVGALQAKKNSLLTKLGRNYEVQLFSFDKGLRRTALRFLADSKQVEGRETHIGAALTDSVKGGANNRTASCSSATAGAMNWTRSPACAVRPATFGP